MSSQIFVKDKNYYYPIIFLRSSEHMKKCEKTQAVTVSSRTKSSEVISH